jgi:deoxyribonuclease-4
MPFFGAHLSIAGGLHNAVAAAVELQCETVQLFTKNASHLNAKPLRASEIEAFRSAVASSGLRFATAHDSYLINLATPDDVLYHKSIAAFVDELRRAEALGLSYLVMHPGAHVGSGEEAGLRRVIAAFDEVHAQCPSFAVKVLVENTAGQGTTLGHRFEHLAAILTGVQEGTRLGICFDTCHAFAAGYPIHEPDGLGQTFERFESIVGLRHLRVFHLNDSLRPFGSRVDRHAGIGLGEIGRDAFGRIVTDPRFHDLPMILETPKEDERGRPMDPVNLNILRGMAARSRRRFAKKRVKPAAPAADQ